MSEVLSAPISAGTGFESGMSAPSFGVGQINAPMSNVSVGGVNSPELNSKIFSMPELNAPSVESLNFDKALPGNLAFTHTDMLWQAPQVPKTEALPNQVMPSDIFDTPQAEIMEEVYSPAAAPDPYATSELGNMFSTEENTQPDIIEETSVISTIALQEVEADTIQAARVADALIAIGIPKVKAEGRVMTVLTQILETKGIAEGLANQSKERLVELQEEKDPQAEDTKTQTAVALQKEDVTQTEKAMLPQSRMKFFERDTNADNVREKLAKKAIDIVFRKLLFLRRRKVLGIEIAKEMPNRPQPNIVKSEIIQESGGRGNDGSYEEFIGDIAFAGEINSPKEADQLIKNAINRKPAVRAREKRSSNSVTIKDIKRVIGKENVIQILK